MSVRGLELQEAALTLISERGYHGTTMKHIAAAVGMQAPSLYYHVGSKQKILRRIMTRGMQRLMDHQTEALTANADPPARLRAITEAHVLLHIRYRRSAMIAAASSAISRSLCKALCEPSAMPMSTTSGS